MSVTGTLLMQQVAERIIMRWLVRQGRLDVHSTGGMRSMGGTSVDVTYAWQGGQHRIKIKPDPYYGTDPMKVADRDLVFYRGDASAYAFEAVANAATREPGWIFESQADDLYYYYLALSQDEQEVRALVSEPDEVFFAELAVERDDLVILPMRDARAWFESNFERYTPRPVMVGGASAWYRLVPRTDIERAVPSIRNAGPIFMGMRS